MSSWDSSSRPTGGPMVTQVRPVTPNMRKDSRLPLNMKVLSPSRARLARVWEAAAAMPRTARSSSGPTGAGR